LRRWEATTKKVVIGGKGRKVGESEARTISKIQREITATTGFP
jgi:hypothetical protein